MTLSVGLIGAGNMASTHATGWHAAGDCVRAVLSAESTRAPQLAARLGAELAPDLDTLLEMVDVVDICSPTHTHLAYIDAAAAAGCSVVCEKPLARTADDARKAVELCAEAGVPLLVAHVVRFFPEYAAARSRVVAGDVGDVAVVRLDRSTYVPMTDDSWFTDTEKSGGVVLDLMIHDVDYAAWVAGDVVRVYGRLAESPSGGGHVLATLRHTTGALTHVQGSWAFPKGSFRTSLEIAGSEGLVTLHGAVPFHAEAATIDDTPDVPEPPTTLAESPYVAQMRHFSDVLRNSVPVRTTPQEAAAAVAVCEAIAVSIASGQAIELEGPVP